jgi:hypothetical protein
MFIEKSAGRIRFARTVFVLAGLLPCAGLVAWALHLRSAAHRESLRTEWQRAVGVPLEIDAVEHPRPGVVRARGCRLTTPDGGRLTLPAVEIETAPTEVRLRIDRLACDVGAARLLGGVVAEWLGREARYPKDCVVEVASFTWASQSAAEGAGLRAECVTRDGTRAVRIVRAAGAEGHGDELRVVRTPAVDGAADDRVEVELTAAGPLPLAIAAGALGRNGLALGEGTMLTGTLQAVREAGRWSGTAAGRVDAIDLAACTAGMQARAAGAATAVVRRLAWSQGRIRDAEIECAAGRGRVEQRLLDGLVNTVGCRPGPAHRTLAATPERTFDAAGCLLRIDGRGVELVSGANLGGALAVADGLALVEPPGAVLPAERLAWLLATPGAVFVPSGGPGAWLLDVMPRAEQAERPGRSGGF